MDREEIADLVHEDRVHARCYTDPAVFELEIERIFRRTWNFACHESQIARPGDFVTLTIARQPIIIARTQEGDVSAMFNRCAHRGSIVCREAAGNAANFTCPFHGWVFRCSGELAGIPYRESYSPEFLAGTDLNLAPVPRMGRYRGFVFVSLSGGGVPFEKYLAPLKLGIDNLLDRAPEGELIADNGLHRYAYKGNWKHQIENGIDEYHPPFAHASTIKDGKQMARAYGSEGFHYTRKDEKSEDVGRSHFDHAEIHGFPYGHSYLTVADRSRVADLKIPAYRELLLKKHGPERFAEIEEETCITNCVFYPNFILRVNNNIHLRVVRPIAVDRSEVWVWPLRFKGAPDDMSEGIMRYANVHTSVASFVQTDDLEVFERCQEGLNAQSPEWVWIARGLGREKSGKQPNELVAQGTWETGMRAQFRYWKEMMTQA